MLQFRDVGHELQVVREKRTLRRERARNQRLADEDVSGADGIDAAVGNTATRHERQSIERDALARDHFPAFRVPVRLEMLARDAIAGDRFDPLRLDLRRAPRIQPRGFDELGGQHPFRRLPGETGSRMQLEPDSARAEVGLTFGILDADVAEKSRQQRFVDGAISRRVDRRRQPCFPFPALLGDFGGELRVHVAPFGEAKVRNEAGTAGVDTPPVRKPLLELRAEEFPQRDERQEIGAIVAKHEVRLIGRLLLRQRPVARIGNRERAGDDEHLGKAPGRPRGEDHAADARIDRQPRELAAQRRQRTIVVDGRQLLQLLVAVRDRARRRRLDKRKCVDGGQSQRRHPQNHGSERRAEDLRLGVLRPRGKVVLAVEPNADAGRDTAAAARALVRRGLRDLFHLQERRLVAHRVALDAREPGIDHEADAGHRQRRLRDVGGEHDPPAARRGEHPLLLLHGEPRVEGQDLDGGRIRAARKAFAEQERGLADLAFTRQEHEDVPRPLAPQVLRRGDDRIFEFLLVVGLLAGRRQRTVANLDRKDPPRNLDHRGRDIRRPEMPREALRVERRRGDDDPEVRPPRQQLLQVPQQEIDVETALVRLVDDDRVVGRERRIALRFREQDAVGHQLDVGAGLRVVGEAHLVADGVAGCRAELVRDSRRDRPRGDAARLRVPDESAVPAPERQAYLRQLRRLSGPRLAADDDHRVIADRRRDLLRALRNGQFGGIRDRRPARRTRRAELGRARDRDRDAFPFGRGGPPSSRTLDAARQRLRVRGHRPGELALSRSAGDDGAIRRNGREAKRGDGPGTVRAGRAAPPILPCRPDTGL